MSQTGLPRRGCYMSRGGHLKFPEIYGHPNPLCQDFPVSRQVMGLRRWRRALAAFSPDEPPERFPDTLERLVAQGVLPPYVPDLARLEWTHYQVGEQDVPASPDEGPAILNQTLELVPCRWHNLPQLLGHGSDAQAAVTAGEELVAVWQDLNGQTHLETARPSDLVALKVVVGETTPRSRGRPDRQPGGTPGRRAPSDGPARPHPGPAVPPAPQPARFGPGVEVAEQFHTAQVFSLQWHLTQACDLHCRHCYDRTPRATPSLAEGLDILLQLQAFCQSRQVFGQVSFTGGNPFLHPHFFELYRTAADLGFGCVILGNPVPEEKLEQLLAICPPLFYQVSLEGLQEHNDEIRGQGNFRRVLGFLEMLRQF